MLTSGLQSEPLKTCIECIARFENLKELELTIIYCETVQPIDDCLSLIGQKCNKLLKLDLDIGKTVKISDRFFDVFLHFKALQILKIESNNNTVINGSVESFKHCKQLKELDINYSELREDFFANIASFVPKLQSLNISTDKEFYDSFINSFHSMKNVQKVKQCLKNDKNWYFGKHLFKVMLSHNGMNVIRVNDNCGLIIDSD